MVVSADGQANDIKWEISVPILVNKHILRQVFWALQISIAFVLVVLLLIQALDPYSKVDSEYLIFLGKLYFILLAVLITCLGLGVLIIMGLRYDFVFIIDNKGIIEKPGKKQRKKNTVVNLLLIVLALFTKRPGLAGTGMLAQSGQEKYICWQDINNITADPISRTILLRRNNRTLMMVFCTRENFEIVHDMISRCTCLPKKASG